MSQNYELHCANVDRLKTNYRVDAEWNLPAKETAKVMWRLLTERYDVRTMRNRDGNS